MHGAGMRSQRFYGAGVFALIAVASCDRSVAPPQMKAAASSAQVRAADVVVEPQWDSFSADVTVRISGGGLPGRPLPERRIAYRTERMLEANGLWSSSIMPTALRAGSLRQFSVSKLVSRSDGSVVVYDSDGKERTWSPPGQEPTASPQRGRRTKPADPRAWLENIVVTQGDRGRRLQLLREIHGAPEIRDGREVYRVERDGKTTEAIADPELGVIVEYRSLRQGVDVGRSTFVYREVSPGVYLQVSSRDEIPADSRRSSMVVDREFSNVRFERKGGR